VPTDLIKFLADDGFATMGETRDGWKFLFRCGENSEEENKIAGLAAATMGLYRHKKLEVTVRLVESD